MLVIFDVNETLSDMSPLAGRCTPVGLPAGVRFASVPRVGLALTVTGDYRLARSSDAR